MTMTLTIVIEFNCDAMSPQRESDIKKIVQVLRGDVEPYSGKVVKAELR